MKFEFQENRPFVHERDILTEKLASYGVQRYYGAASGLMSGTLFKYGEYNFVTTCDTKLVPDYVAELVERYCKVCDFIEKRIPLENLQTAIRKQS